MTRDHEAIVAARGSTCFMGRFKPEVRHDDVRLSAIVAGLGPVRGLRILDLGCGKGRFAASPGGPGAEVIGLDLSAAMLAGGRGPGSRPASARRLPLRRRALTP